MARKYTILCVGKMKSDPLLDVIDHYMKQLSGEVQWIEIATSDLRSENLLIRKEIIRQKTAHWVALDARGKVMSSEGMASMMEPHNHIGFIIGGADGLDKETLGLCQDKIAFGIMIWPHKLARAMLIEQIYRSEAIWNNHPYHRAGNV